MKTILVTGGSGYIGSHTCLNLLESGYKVYVIDSLENSSFESISRVNTYFKNKFNLNENKIKFFKADLRNFEQLRIIFDDAKNNNNNFEGVIHFAGLKSVSESQKDPSKYWENNVNGTINLINIMESYKCNRLVFSSSATVYGDNQLSPISEEAILNPSNFYGKTKKTIEDMLLNLHLYKSWSIALLRYFNPAGAHKNGIIGEDPKSNKNNLFPILCEVAKNERDKLFIFGNNWPTRDGTCIRDYLHVEDLAIGHKNALNYLNNGKNKLLKLNLGSGIGTTVLELINIFEKVNKVKIEYEFSKKRDGDCSILFADSKLAEKILSWKTKKSLENICEDSWRWALKNPNGYSTTFNDLDLSIYNEA